MSFSGIATHLERLVQPTDMGWQAKALVDVRAHWITPEEQLSKLCLDTAEEVSRISSLIPTIGTIVAKYTLNEEKTHWYTSLYELQSLPEKIPPLPRHIDLILQGKCPIYNGQKKGDETCYQTKDTHILALIPEEFGSLRLLIEKFYSLNQTEEKPHLTLSSLHEKYQLVLDSPFAETHWVLITKATLPSSKNMTWAQQADLVNHLSCTTFIHYKIPTIQQNLSVLITHMAVNRNRPSQANKQPIIEDTDTWFRVQETADKGFHLSIGVFPHIHPKRHWDESRLNYLGILALRKL